MKKKMLVILSALVMLMTVCLSSCFLDFGDVGKYPFKFDDTWEAESRERLFNALKQRDKELLRALFAPAVIEKDEDFDENLNEFFNYYKGEFISVENNIGGIVSDSSHNGEFEKELSYGYTYLTTSEGVYRIGVRDKVIDTAHPDRVGLRDLSIINEKDDIDPDTPYGGGKSPDGLNIGVQKTLAYNEFSISLRAIQENNRKDLISVFADNIQKIEGFEEGIDALMSYYQGKWIDYEQPGAVVTKNPSYAPDHKQIDASFDVETDKGNYRIAMRFLDYFWSKKYDYDQYTADYGVRSFYIIKAEEDTDLSVPYWGDGKFTNGIHIGVKNVIAQS